MKSLGAYACDRLVVRTWQQLARYHGHYITLECEDGYKTVLTQITSRIIPPGIVRVNDKVSAWYMQFEPGVIAVSYTHLRTS